MLKVAKWNCTIYIVWKSVFFNILKVIAVSCDLLYFWESIFSSGLEIKMCLKLEVTVRAAAESIQNLSKDGKFLLLCGEFNNLFL